MTEEPGLLDLAGVDGFMGAALFSAQGELLAALGGGDAQLEEAGRLAAAVLESAKRAAAGIGAGRGHHVHVAGEKAHVLAACLNEGSDPLRSEPGRAHLHLVVILGPAADAAGARARMAASLRALAARFRA